MNTAFLIKFLLIIGIMGTHNPDGKTPEYHIEQPRQTLVLPDALQEVSGITDLDDSQVLCVQDENGILFILNIHTGELTQQLSFGEDGDYEGITRVEDTIYILRSDGMLIELADWRSDEMKTTLYTTNIPARNSEGLCYDPVRKRLLIASKTQPGPGAEFKDLRTVYAFDLESKTLSEEPVYTFSVQEIARAAKAQGLELPIKVNKKTGRQSEHFRLGISALAIHPQTGELYMLCAIDFMYLLFDGDGKLKTVRELPKALYPQAEGITFLNDGTMIITSEGVGGKAQLSVIDMKM